MSQNIIVERLRHVNACAPLKAYADIRLSDGILIKDCRIIQQDGQQAWLSMPRISWTPEGENKPHYKPLVILPKDLQKAAQIAALNAFTGGTDE